jgi:hypothetical protein
VKLPEPIQTYFPSLEIDKLLSQSQSFLSPDYLSSSYSFDDTLESLDIAMPLPVSNQLNCLCRNQSLENIYDNLVQALDTENNVQIV